MGRKMGAKSRVKRKIRSEKIVTPPSCFESEISDFLAWIQLEKGLAKNTVESYEADLIQCSLHLERQGVSSWQSISFDNLSNWLSSLSEEEYAVASLSRKLSAVRALAKFLTNEGRLREDFTELFSNPKKGRYLPNCLTIDEEKNFELSD